jgi:hypothetical protein
LKSYFPNPVRPVLCHGEDFDRGRLIRGNKTAVVGGSCEARIAIFPDVSTRLSSGTILPSASWGCEGLFAMLRAAPSRIGRRIADILAIAAASLPVAGA